MRFFSDRQDLAGHQPVRIAPPPRRIKERRSLTLPGRSGHWKKTNGEDRSNVSVTRSQRQLPASRSDGDMLARAANVGQAPA